jgi:hypothetical protein
MSAGDAKQHIWSMRGCTKIRNVARNAAECREREPLKKERNMSKLKGNLSPAEEEPTTASFHFREKGKVQPKGYAGLGIDVDVTVTIKGKVKQIGSSWNDGANFTVEIGSCEITVPAEGNISLSSAVEEANKSRKKV